MIRSSRSSDRNSSTHGRSASRAEAAGSSYGRRTGGAPRSSSPRGRQGSSVQGEFALPVSSTPALPAVEAFSELDMPGALLETLARQGVSAPFPIQAATLPNSLAGRDVLGRGRTGSGKTIAFGLAVLARTAGRRAESRQPLALVLVPTRELAQQVTEALTPYAHAVRLRLATVVGGMSISRQAQALQRGAELVVATPGRLKDLIERGDCRLDQVTVTVLDEADQMADMGFLPQVTELLDQVAPGGQTMLFSATLDRNVDRLVRRFLKDPVTHSVDPSSATVSTMEHHLLHVQGHDKNAAIAHIASRAGESGTVVTLVLPNQRREMTRMMHTAGITPHTTQVHSADSELARITGACVPTGIPVQVSNPVVERPRRNGSAGRSNPRNRSTSAARGANGAPVSRSQPSPRTRVAA